jgi:hypothetical protein
MFSFKPDHGSIETYTFTDADEMMRVGMSLIKNSLLSTIIINEETVKDPNETMQDFVDQVGEDIYADSNLFDDLEQYTVYSDEESSLLTSDLDSEEEDNITETKPPM